MITVGIGDITIALEGHDNLRHQDTAYSLFLNNHRPDLILRASSDSYPLTVEDEKDIAFEAKDSWSIAEKDNNFIIRTTSATAVIDTQLKNGTIFSNIDNPAEHEEFSLTYPLAEILMIKLLSQQRGILVHACGIAYHGKGFLFLGSSGAGKSTIANLWSRKDDTDILSDDRIIIRNKDDSFFIYGTPWHGQACYGCPEKASLGKIFFLRQACRNYTKKLSVLDATCRLMVTSFAPFWNTEEVGFTLDFISRLAGHIPCFELGFVPNTSVIEYLNDFL